VAGGAIITTSIIITVRIDPTANPAIILTSSSLPLGAKDFLRLAILSNFGGTHIISVIRTLVLFMNTNNLQFKALFFIFRKFKIMLN
jgi:hypothetical protein